jgi:rhodanese-related sulfurtransferase
VVYDLEKSSKEIDTVNRINAEEFAKEVVNKVDIRKDSEYSAEHVEDAFSKPLLSSINDWIKDIDPKEPFSCIVQVDTVA